MPMTMRGGVPWARAADLNAKPWRAGAKATPGSRRAAAGLPVSNAIAPSAHRIGGAVRRANRRRASVAVVPLGHMGAAIVNC